ncbi:hypothetical protein ACN2XU_09195 [Primorskyibacter sp. 2E107]|uniref:hypothetical protein n=1 Tax=Primorskyibacter sp. 2E107 TaxID=3403458 RepID=UPI003AF9A6F0
MKIRKCGMLAMVIVSLSACSQTKSLLETSRNDTSFLVEPVAVTSARERAITEEAIALEDSIRDILLQAKAPAGDCSGTLSDPAMAQCSERDLMGRTLGALRSLTTDNGPLNKNALAPAITQTFAALDSIDSGINAMLREQAEEMDMLDAERASGHLTEAEHATRLTHMQQARVAVAEALALSARRAGQGRASLEAAQASDPADLSWYIASMAEIETRSLAARNRLGLS